MSAKVPDRWGELTLRVMRGLGRRAVPDTEMFDELRSFVLLAMVAMVGLMLWSLQSCIGTNEARRNAEYEVYAQSRIESIREHRQFVDQFVDQFSDNLTYLTQIQILSSRIWLNARTNPSDAESDRDAAARETRKNELTKQWDELSVQWANNTKNYASLIALSKAYYVKDGHKNTGVDVASLDRILTQIQLLVDLSYTIDIYEIERALSEGDKSPVALYCDKIVECISATKIPEGPRCQVGRNDDEMPTSAEQARTALKRMHANLMAQVATMRDVWSQEGDNKHALIVDNYIYLLWMVDEGITELLSIVVLDMIRSIPSADEPRGYGLATVWEAVRVVITVGVVFALVSMYRGISAMRTEYVEDRRRIRRRSQVVWGKRRIQY